MKILAIGDFHGEFPKKIYSIVKREEIDLVVSIGDYPSFSLKKEFFKYSYKKVGEKSYLWNFIGKKKYKEAVIEDHKKAEEVIRKLNNLAVPVLSVLGNHDRLGNDVYDAKKPGKKDLWKWDWENRNFIKRTIMKYDNVHLVDYSYFISGDFVFIGGSGSSFPGRVKSKAYKKHKKILEDLFKKFRKENKEGKVIFLYHNSPYETKLDKITAKDAHKKVIGKHYGSKMSRRVIDKHQPVLSLSGHIDEGRGQQKLGKTLAVNVGSVHEGYGAIIEFPSKGAPKVKPLRLK